MRVLAAVLFTMLVPFVVYLLGAFIAAEMNPFDWMTEGRILYVVVCVVAMARVAECALED